MDKFTPPPVLVEAVCDNKLEPAGDFPRIFLLRKSLLGISAEFIPNCTFLKFFAKLGMRTLIILWIKLKN